MTPLSRQRFRQLGKIQVQTMLPRDMRKEGGSTKTRTGIYQFSVGLPATVAVSTLRPLLHRQADKWLASSIRTPIGNRRMAKTKMARHGSKDPAIQIRMPKRQVPLV